MIQFETEVIDIIERTHNVKSFRFKVKEDIDFNPGQFFFVGIMIDGQERTKHFSFSNSPTEKGYIEFTKRITPSPFSKALNVLKVGGWAKIKLPYGTFTFKGEHNKVAFLSGGIGITPIRSIAKFATDTKLSSDLALVYGNNKEEDIIFRQDFSDMAAHNKSFRVVYTLTSPDLDKSSWNGRTGPPAMVEGLVNVLKNELGIQDSKIKLENFTGY